MQIKRLSPAGCEELYHTALPRDFPAAECKPFAEIRRLLEAGAYEPLLLTDDAGARLAYAWQVVPGLSGRRCWTILPCGVICAGSGVGTAALQLIRDYYALRVQDLLLECEHPAEALDPAVARGGASGFTCGPGRAPLRWRAACSAAGMRCFPLPCGGALPDAVLCKELRASTRSWCRSRIAAAGHILRRLSTYYPPKGGNGV